MNAAVDQLDETEVEILSNAEVEAIEITVTLLVLTPWLSVIHLQSRLQQCLPR